MSNPIDVGSVLGGRYKVTATVLASHDHDLVLDGVDQVLNRPVSILVAGPENTEQVAQSAREVATGERPGTVQVLDLGVTEDATYLITNHTSAADLLDLVVAPNPPYVEPFFTDTLGSEIFGQARSHEPEPYDEEDHVEAGYISYADSHPNPVDNYRSAPERSAPERSAPAVPPRPPVRPAAQQPTSQGRSGAAAAGAAAAGAAAAGAGAAKSGASRIDPDATAAQPVAHTAATESGRAVSAEADTGPNDTAAPAGSPAGEQSSAADQKPKVSLWSNDDYAQSGGHDAYEDSDGAVEEQRPVKGKAALFARAAAPAAAGVSFADRDDDDDDRDESDNQPRSMRWLVGGLLAVVLIAGLIFAVTNLGSLFTSEPQAKPTAAPVTSSAPQNSATATQAAPSAPPAVPPVIESVSRQGNFDFAATFDGDLVKAYDGNAASYWSDMEFATENWGGLAPQGVPLVVKLKGTATISSITLSQLGGSGGNITVYTNDRPSTDGAKAVGTNSFTSTDLNMPLSEPVQAQYVIISINSLPKLAAPKTRYGYGLRLAEIKVQ
ncbi:discoidin domain-containing protein [Pseudarthrobacter sp. CC12]|uniref:discoidin domain-containing protein n=1 Tax=unclassified Pseudarthrobacter TaxID=2647000 RepID=UPI0011406345|nr:discoidin domain-containing protein [Pseudarthrobacter sp. NIBRBAC000502770]QDG90158.1 ABC transporter substrate-binding protein [Pseudarthrobacter sp. NIBRBAC000502770]